MWKSYKAGDIRAAMPLLLIYTDMMPSEMQRLKVENIDLDNHKIVSVGMKTKVGKERPSFLPNDILPVVEDLECVSKSWEMQFRGDLTAFQGDFPQA